MARIDDLVDSKEFKNMSDEERMAAVLRIEDRTEQQFFVKGLALTFAGLSSVVKLSEALHDQVIAPEETAAAAQTIQPSSDPLLNMGTTREFKDAVPYLTGALLLALMLKQSHDMLGRVSDIKDRLVGKPSTPDDSHLTRNSKPATHQFQ